MYGKIALEGQLTTGQDVQMELTPLNDQLDNYYQSDAISRSSTTMAKCTAAFNPVKFSNFKSQVVNVIGNNNF